MIYLLLNILLLLFYYIFNLLLFILLNNDCKIIFQTSSLYELKRVKTYWRFRVVSFNETHRLLKISIKFVT